MEHLIPLSDILPEYECQVCKELMMEPVLLSECGHTFCKSCVLKVKDNIGPKHCPNCRKTITGGTQTNFAVKTLVTKVRVKCKRCKAEDTIEVLVKHKCPEEEVQCSNEGCRTLIKRKDKVKHADECLYKTIYCEQCHKETTVASQEVHVEQLCSEGKITCPLKCRLRPKRKELQLHLTACEELQRKCEVTGCHFWGNARSMAKHKREQAEKHVALLQEERGKLQHAVLNGDKNVLTTRTAVSIASFNWTIDAFKERAESKLALSQTVPLESSEFQLDGKQWRLLLYVGSPTCSLYVQLRSAVSTPRIAIRFIISGSTDTILTLKDQRIKEGEMFGTDVPLDCLEKRAEERHGWLWVKIFIEKVDIF